MKIFIAVLKSTTVQHRQHRHRPPQQPTPPTRQTRLLPATLCPTRRCITKRKLRLPHVDQLTLWLIELAPPALILQLRHLQTNVERDPTACSAAPTSVSAPTTPPRSALDTIRILTSPAPHPPPQLPSFSPRFFLPRHISTPPTSPICNPTTYFPCLLVIHPSSDSPVKDDE